MSLSRNIIMKKQCLIDVFLGWEALSTQPQCYSSFFLVFSSDVCDNKKNMEQHYP